MGWARLDPKLLRVGLYIKIDHAWMQHPFVRNTFTVSSPTEIAIIQNHGLTNLFYDPELSHADIVETLNDPTIPVSSFEHDPEFAEDVAADERAMLREKTIHIQKVVDHRKAVEESAKEYVQSANEAAVMMAMANAGQPEALDSAHKILDAMSNILSEESVALTLVCTVNPSDPGQEMAMQAVSTSALSLMVSKTLNLNEEESRQVGLGALFHNIGLNKVPMSIRGKSGYLLPVEQKLMQMYPQFGKEILENIPGVPSDVIDIVHQHREALDGSGYPKRLFNGDIAKKARLVGAIVEYNQLINDRRSGHVHSPSHALSHLYTNLKNKYGADVIEPFIASITVFPPGSFIELNDKSFGLVLKSNQEERMRPVIMLYESDASHNQAAIVDLSRERSLSIQRSLDPRTLPSRVKEVLSPGRFKGYMISSSSKK